MLSISHAACDVLVEKAKVGDQKAFDQLLELFRPLSITLCSRYWLPGADFADVLQVARLALWSAVEDYEVAGGRNFSSFYGNLVLPRLLATTLTGHRTQKHQALNTAFSIHTLFQHDADSDNSANDNDHVLFLADRFDFVADVMQRLEFVERLDALRPHLTHAERRVLEAALARSDTSYTDLAEDLQIKTKQVDNAWMGIRRKAHRVVQAEDGTWEYQAPARRRG